MFVFFFVWVFLWLDNWMCAPYHWDALGYVGPHTMDIFRNKMLPFLCGPIDVGHPTLVYWLDAVSWHIFGVSPLGAHLVHFGFGALYLLYVYKICLRWTGAGAALGAALLSFLQPIFASQTALLTLDVPMTALFAAAFYYALRSNRPVRLALFSIALVLTKLQAFLLLGPLACVIVFARYQKDGEFKPRRWIRYLWPLAAAFGVLLAFGVLRYLIAGTILYRFHSPQLQSDWRFSAVAHAAFRICKVFQSYLGLGPLFWVVLAGACAFLWRRRWLATPKDAPDAPSRRTARSVLPLIVALATLSIFYLLPHLIRSLDPVLPRYLLVFMPPLLPFLALGLHSLYKLNRPASWVIFVLVAGILLCRWKPEYARDLPVDALSRALSYDAVAMGDGSGETNMQWADYVRCLEKAGRYADKHLPPETEIMASYPVDSAFRQPFLGYVENPYRVWAQYDLDAAVGILQKREVDIWVWSSLSQAPFSPDDVLARVPLLERARWEKGGYVCVIYAPIDYPTLPQLLTIPKAGTQ